MSVQDAISRIVSVLDRCQIPYMLTGSFASVHYGSPRTTQDVDFIVSPADDQLRKFVSLLPSESYYVDVEAALEANRRRSMFNVLDLVDGWKFDFIIRKTRPFSEEEFRRRIPTELAGINLFVASPEDIIVSKLEWAKLGQSQRHIDDAAGVLKMKPEGLDRSYIAKWIDELGLHEQWEEVLAALGNRKSAD